MHDDGAPARRRACAGPAGVLALLAMSGCASVHIDGGDGDVRVERQLGMLSVQLAPRHRSLLAQTTALGVVRAWDGMTLGYYDASLVALAPDDCRVVVWVERTEQVDEVNRLLAGRPDVCVYPQGEVP